VADAANRYYRRGGRVIRSRLFPSLLIFGSLLGLPILLVFLASAFGAVDGLEILAVICGGLALLSFFGAVVAAWALIFVTTAKLDKADFALFQGNRGLAMENAQWVLAWMFRSDKRMRAFYMLALVAEQNGDFAEAAAIFAAAQASTPLMAASHHATRARALITGHLALDHAATGDLAGARFQLQRCHAALSDIGKGGGIFSMLSDDAAFGAAGLNSSLALLEPRRDPRAIAALAGALLAFREGNHYAALDLVTREGTTFAYGLSPQERALLARIERECHLRLAAQDAHRTPARIAESAAPEGDPAEAWADAVFDGPTALRARQAR
jgi:tetratricopeptide (TPR) repeat protein